LGFVLLDDSSARQLVSYFQIVNLVAAAA